MKSYKLPFTLLALLLLALGHICFAQQLPPDRSAANTADVAGTWMIYTRGDDGKTGTHTVQIVQNGTTLTGHFKGPNQSGGIEGTVNVRHIVFRTKTRNVLTFRGMVDGNTMEGNFGIRGHHGTWQGRRAD
jgi:hypothetical protein